MSEHAKVYLARAGGSGEDEEYVLEHGVAVIGFREVPSLKGATDYDQVLKIVQEAKPDAKPRANGNFAGQLWAFAVAMKEGDIVVLPRKLTSQVALGRVAGPYEYTEVGTAFRHTRPVKWDLHRHSQDGVRPGPAVLVRRVHDRLQRGARCQRGDRRVIEELKPYPVYRESGLESLGRIPAHWRVTRAKYLFSERDVRSTTGTEELLSVWHITGVTPRSHKSVSMFLAESTGVHADVRVPGAGPAVHERGMGEAVNPELSRPEAAGADRGGPVEGHPRGHRYGQLSCREAGGRANPAPG